VLRIWPALWSFLRNSEVPPTNNAAEQALRSIVLERKISGPTRSRRGEEFLAHGYTVFETCRRQGRDLLSFMHHAVVAWIDKTPAPSLVPVPAASG
jgi:transposase